MARAGTRLMIAVAMAGVLLVAALAWLASGAGLPFVLAQGERLIARGGGELSIQGARGSLLSGIGFDRLRWSDGKTAVEARAVNADWSWRQLLKRRLLIGRVEAGEVIVNLPAADASDQARTDIAMPGPFGLPIDLTMERVRIDRLRINPASPSAPIELTDIGFAARHEQGHYEVSDLHLVSPWVTLSDARASLADSPPHALSLQADLAGPVPLTVAGHGGASDDKPRFTGRLDAEGDLDRLSTHWQLQAFDSRVTLGASIAPLARSPILSADLQLMDFSPAAVSARLPVAAIDGQLSLRTDPAQTGRPWRLEVTVLNQGPGALDAGSVPVSRLAMSAALDDPLNGPLQAIVVDRLSIDLAGRNLPGRIVGNGEVRLDQPRIVGGIEWPSVLAQFEVHALDLAQLGLPQLPTALEGRIALERERIVVKLTQSGEPAARPVATKAAADKTQGLPLGPLALTLTGALGGTALTIDELSVNAGPTRADAKGRITLASPIDAMLEGTFRQFDLQHWIPASAAIEPRWRNGVLNGQWQLEGRLTPDSAVRTKIRLNDSRLLDQPLSAKIDGRLTLNGAGGLRGVDDLDAALRWGRNTFSARGSLGAGDGDGIRLKATMFDPQWLEPRLTGRVDLNAQVVGPLADLRSRLDVDARRLRWRDGQTQANIASLKLTADLPVSVDPPPDGRLAATIDARRLRIGTNRIERMQLDLDGTPRQHHLQASARGDRQVAILELNGSASLGAKPAWQGMIEQLAIAGRVNAVLERPADLRVDARQIALDAATLQVGASGRANGRIDVEQLRVTLAKPGAATPPVAIQGAIKQLPVADIVSALTGDDLPAEMRRMRLSGQLDLQGTSLDDLTGIIDVDLTEAAGETGGLLANASNRLRARLDQGSLDGQVDITLPSLAFSRRFTGSDWQFDGLVSLAGSVGGSLRSPDWNVNLTGRDLSLLQPALGWRLQDGALKARIQGRTLELSSLTLRTGDGDLKLDGQATLIDPATGGVATDTLPLRGSFRLTTRGFIVPIGPGQQLALSGSSLIVASDRALTWEGQMAVDQGLIEIAGSGVPSLPDDVQIIDAGKPAVQTKPASADDSSTDGQRIAVATNLAIDLGERLRVTGGGVNATLGGELLLKGVLPADPRIEGSVNIASGSYTAYSQDLKITTGTVRFNGPIDNPALNIEAQRPNLPVEVGVGIRGTALSPRVELFSVPAMSDAEKLSWLVLGQPIANAQGGAETLALKEAASRLLGQDDGSISGGGFADKLGLDSLGFGFASDTGQAEGVRDSGQPAGLPGAGGRSSQETYREVVSLGKRLSDRLLVSYEQGVRGVYSLLRVQYELSQRLSLRAQTGSESAVDLLYFWNFD